MPLGLDQRGDGADDEEVVGVGEEAHAGDEDGPMMEPAGRRLVEEFGDRWPRRGEATLGKQMDG